MNLFKLPAEPIFNMAKAPPSSRNQTSKGSSKPPSKSDGSGITSRHYRDPATPRPNTGSEPTSRVVKSRATQVCVLLPLFDM